MSNPAVSVCVASHERPLRLRWLLNALAEQSLPAERFEVVVATDSRGPTEEVLTEHPLVAAGVLRPLFLDPPQTAASLRNAAWRDARAPFIAFTDDDCRPPREWLENLHAAAEGAPGSIIQGATHPDPDEAGLLVAAGFHRTVRVAPPDAAAQTCNIAYPRELLHRLGGFDESLSAAEDTELAMRARSLGVQLVPAPDALTFHAIEPAGVRARMRSQWRYIELPAVVSRHPALREELVAGVFWKPTHARLAVLLGAIAAALALRRPVLALGTALWWGWRRAPSYGGGARGRLRSLAELPGHAAIDGAEMAACAVGSVRNRTLVL